MIDMCPTAVLLLALMTSETSFTQPRKETTAQAVNSMEADDNATRVAGGVNSLVYPLGSFVAQVEFAQKRADLTNKTFHETVYDNTGLPRIVLGTKQTENEPGTPWSAIVDSLTDTQGTSEFAAELYDIYARQPHSHYQSPGLPFGAFTYDHREDRNAIVLHFDNPKRGISPLSAEAFPERQAEFAALLQDARKRHPEVTNFMTGTWLFAVPGFANLFPDDILLGPPERLSFAGDSLWGQLVNKSGNLNSRVFDTFIKSIRAATNPEQVEAALPYPVLFTFDTISKYYRMYETTA